jgi:hypothetical protein
LPWHHESPPWCRGGSPWHHEGSPRRYGAAVFFYFTSQIPLSQNIH